MSELDRAMMKYISHIVLVEHRPFSYRDCLRFTVDEKEYGIAHGTFRNKVSRLIREGKVVMAYNSGIAFYSLKGITFGKPKFTMTPDRTGVIPLLLQDPIIKLIESLPMDMRALHDIRFRFEVPGIWSTLSANSQLVVDPVSKDIRLKACEIDGLLIRITIHKTDTITVIVACSCSPVAIDISGIIRLSNALTRVEERLSKLVYDCLSINADSSNITQEVIIPAHNSWIVTLWHFGTDSLVRYAGEKFEVTWEVAENVLVRVYTKDLKEKGTRIRLERQEYPNKTFAEAVEEKLNSLLER